MRLRLAFSPCPNDTFIFEALIKHRVDTEGLEFEVLLADIAELNDMALRQSVDVCKVSFYAYAKHLQNDWHLHDSGAALGRACGPLIVAKDKDNWKAGTIAIPGMDTTAHFLLNFFAPDAGKRKAMLFSEIMPAVASGRLQAGVIIHESRFVYQNYGLEIVQDLGAYWEKQTGLPIPLGGIVASQALGAEIHAKLDRSLRRSVEYAFANREMVMPFVRKHAQEMAVSVTESHIALYVNDFTHTLGIEGKKAVDFLLRNVNNQAQILSP